jgi:hypothetical protein
LCGHDDCFNARDALITRDRVPSPVALLDLSILTTAAIFFDEIVMQPQRFAPVDDSHDLTQVIPSTTEGRGEWAALYDDVWKTFSAREMLACVVGRWATFFGVKADTSHVNLGACRFSTTKCLTGTLPSID